MIKMKILKKDSPTDIIWFIIFGILPALIVIAGYIWGKNFFGTKEQFQNWVSSFGYAAPFGFFILQIAQVVLTPINHYVVGILGGAMFGLWPGFILNWAGRTIGSAIAFFIAKIFGRPIVRRFITDQAIDKYDKYATRGGWILFLIYFLPFFPDDEITYLAGVSKMPKQVFFPAMIIGHVGGSLALAYAGAGINVKDTLFYIILIITFISGIALTILLKGRSEQLKMIKE